MTPTSRLLFISNIFNNESNSNKAVPACCPKMVPYEKIKMSTAEISASRRTKVDGCLMRFLIIKKDQNVSRATLTKTSG